MKSLRSARGSGALGQVVKLVLSSLLLAISACTSKPHNAPSQVAARVGDDEVSIHEVNALLAKLPVQSDQQRLRDSVLQKLVDERLAADQAIVNKLDRSPQVVLALEQAKHEILAQAYLQQVVSRMPKPTLVEVNRYYDEHPELFAQRRIYTLREIEIKPAAATTKTSVEALVKEGRSAEEVAAWLQSNKIAFDNNTATRPADDLPMVLMSKLRNAKDGSVISLETPGDDLHVIQIMSSQATQMDRATAQAKIERFLINNQAREAVRAELKRLRSVTKIEYLGGFTKPPDSVASPLEPSDSSDALPSSSSTDAPAQ